MAKRRGRKGKYRMTPRRRAALAKAQAASARKRRKNVWSGRAKTVGAVGAAIGGTFVAYHTNRYIVRPDIAVRHARVATRTVTGATRSAVRRAQSLGNRKPAAVPNKQNKDWSKFGYL